LNENGTLTGSTSLRLVQNGQTIDSDVFHQTGTWTRSGNTISMLVTEDGQSFNSTATVLNGTLSANIDGVVYIYRR
jgi:hypothetical protein